MKINTSNYFDKIAKLKVSDLPEALKNGHGLAAQAAEDNWEAYNDATIKRVVDLYFEKLGQFLDINGKKRSDRVVKSPKNISFKTGSKIRTSMRAKTPTNAPKRKKRTTTIPKTKRTITFKTGAKIRARMSQKSKEKDCDCDEKHTTHKTRAKAHTPKSNTSHTSKEKPIVEKKTPVTKSGNIEKISPEVKYIKRFVNLQGNTKTQSQILAFIRDLQKAISERLITKASKYASEVMEVQDALLKVNNAFNGESDTIKFVIKESLFDKLKAIAIGDVVYWEVYFAKRIINLQGKETKAKAERIKKEIDAKVNAGAIKESNKPYHNFKILYGALVAYIESNGGKLAITQQALYGIKAYY